MHEQVKETSKPRVTGLRAGNFPHKGPVTRKMFPFDDVIMSHHHHRGHNHRRTVAIFFHNFPITTTVTIRIEEKHYCYYHIHRCLELLS